MAEEQKIRVQRDWIDYANLAANLVQVQQIGSLKGQITAKATQEAEEKELRDAVYELDDWLQRGLKVIDSHPRHVFFIATTVKNGVARHRVSVRLSSFADKDWVRTLVTRADDAINESRKRMTDEQYFECLECLRLADEDERLVAAASRINEIKALKGKEDLLRKEVERDTALAVAKKERFEKRRQRAQPFLPVIFFAAAILVPLGLIFCAQARFEASETFARGVYCILSGVAVFAAGAHLRSSGWALQEISVRIDQTSKKVAALQLSLQHLGVDQIPKSWLQLSSDELKQMRIERARRIEVCFEGPTR